MQVECCTVKRALSLPRLTKLVFVQLRDREIADVLLVNPATVTKAR